MDYTAIVVLLIVAFIFVGFITRFLPYGVITMIACVAFVLLGVVDIPTAFSGLSNSTTILVACMSVIATQLGRTNAIAKLRNSLTNTKGKKGIFLLIPLFAVTILLAQFMGQIACLSVLLLFVMTLADDDNAINKGRIFFVICILNTIWTAKMPFGLGAATPMRLNAVIEGFAPDKLLGFTDMFKAALLPGIAGIAYCLFCNKFVPKSELANATGTKAEETHALSKKDEIITWSLMIIVTLGLMLSNVIGANIANIIPAAAVLIFIITKTMKVNDVVKLLTQDMIWMVAGMLTISAVISSTGVGALIGETVLKILGSNPSGLTVAIVFSVATALMTNFLANLGTSAVMLPIAVSTAVAGGFNVQALALIVEASAWFAFLFPTASPGAAMAFGISNQNPFKALKFTVPLFLIEIVTLLIGVQLFFGIA